MVCRIEPCISYDIKIGRIEDDKSSFIEWNEVNSDIVNKYLSRNRFDYLAKLFNFTTVKTHSEDQYEKLEPWIQWVSVHTGETADEHGVFQLGDIDQCASKQIFEKNESVVMMLDQFLR